MAGIDDRPVAQKVDFSRSQALHSLDSIEWSNTSAVSTSEQGAQGVFFVQFHGGAVVVVKASWEPAQEWFGLLLAQHLKFKAPTVRLLKRHDDETRAMWRAIEVAT